LAAPFLVASPERAGVLACSQIAQFVSAPRDMIELVKPAFVRVSLSYLSAQGLVHLMVRLLSAHVLWFVCDAVVCRGRGLCAGRH
jgi:hypothetical protein